MTAPALSNMKGTATAVAASEPILAHPGLYERTFRLIVAPGDVAELRALKVTSRDGRSYEVLSGYYDDPAAFARDVRRLDGRARGVFMTLNPLRRELLARSPNKLTPGCAAASDADVTRRRWLLIDLDPKRPPGVSATDDELSAAIARADECWLYLRGEKWPEPVSAISGNGAHLLYAIDLPAADGGRVRHKLVELAKRFSNDRVELDTSVSNASRITKVYGTLTRKGAATEERPHRRSILLTSGA
jgi:hypothetical protein